MPIAAIPNYIAHDFTAASPGMRFGMYLPLWGVNCRTEEVLWTTADIDYKVQGQQRQEREIKVENKGEAIRQACALNKDDQRRMAALAERINLLAESIPAAQRFSQYGKSVAPFTTGLGNEHPLENGFAFLNPYGLPYLPGSGVKGVLRQAARELASGEWGNTHDWTDEASIVLQLASQHSERVHLSLLDVLFGRETDDGDTGHVRGALSFWDVIPQIEGDKLAVEIMTPHQSHYYQQKSENKSGGSATPHESGQPNPISFLTVPPGSGFAFHVQCDLAHLTRLAPELVEDNRWKTLLEAAFEHAFHWLGFGAKTAVGYGAMHRDVEAEKKAENDRLQRDAEAERAQMSDEQRACKDFEEQYEKAKNAGPFNPGGVFNEQRLAFLQAALEWENPADIKSAYDLLDDCFKWGKPSKSKKAEIRNALEQLRQKSGT